MSDATTQAPAEIATLSRPRGAVLLVCIAVFLTALQYTGLLPAALHRLPEALVPNFADWLDAIFNFVKDDLGLLVLTRWLTEILQWFLDVTGNLFYGKRRWPNIGPIPWTAIAAAAAVLGYYLGGWKMASLAAATFIWTALVGQWSIAMQTMSVLVIAAPSAFVIGLSLGIAAWKSPAFDRGLKPVLSVLQTLPFFTYLLPAVIFFKVGPTAGAVATTIYAIPPMILMTTLGLQKVSPEVVEAGHMSGCTKLQLLRHVYLPSARTEILVGVNQVIMLCLAMVVLTAFI
ncbi:MAG: ABC transporter permease subunit, partial [Planktotalea arctica]